MRDLNREHRAADEPTDVLAFPVDEAGPTAGPRELGDVAICPGHAPTSPRPPSTASSTSAATTTRPTPARCSPSRLDVMDGCDGRPAA